jgi:D-threo-aldose 1-dehydrogenase
VSVSETPAPVDLRPLGSTSIRTSSITLGSGYLGTGTEPGDSGEAQAIALGTAMLHGPYALIDTSNNYGAGRSEQVLGRALATAGIATGRDIVTKTDQDPETGRFDRDRVRRSFEESCQRLGVDHLGLLHLHDPFSITFQEAVAPGGAVQGMLELREEGLVDAIGIAAGPLALVQEYVHTDAFDVVLTHNRFTLVDRSAVPLLESARERGMGTFNAAPFGGGLLAKGAASGRTYSYRTSPPALLAWVARAEVVCARHHVGLATAALHFSLRSPLIDSTIVGITRLQYLDELEQMRTTPVPEELWAELDALGPAPSTNAD